MTFVSGRNTNRENNRTPGIDTSDIPELDEDFFREAKLRRPKAKQLISLRIDADVLDWFKRQGKGYQTKINAVLRAYVRVHRR